jgi:hypothetical protein
MPSRVQPSESEETATWTEPNLRRAVESLYRRLAGQSDGHKELTVVEGVVNLGLQPEILDALQERWDPDEAVRELGIRYAFEALIVQGHPMYQLDPMSRALIEQTLDLIHRRAEGVARRIGENPLDEDPALLYKLCETASRWIPSKPLGYYITWKLQRYEGKTSRAMRQIENLVKHPQVVEPFVAYVLEADAEDDLKAHLLRMARGGGRKGVDVRETIRFFARPETVAFVKRFAGTVQTARTLYAEEEYAEIAWQGKRKLPANRRQGYLEAALTRIDPPKHESLEELEAKGKLPEVPAEPETPALRTASFERWVTEHAVGAEPEDPLWQVAALRYIRGMSPAEILAQGLASEEALEAVHQRIDSLRANPDVWQAWMEATLS